MFYLLGACVTLVSFLALNAAASAAVVLIAPSALAREGDPERRAARLLALRLFPATASIAVTATIVAPSYLVLEPDAAGETASAAMLLLAGAGLLVIAAAAWRGLAAARATRRIVGSWMRSAQSIALSEAGVPSFRIEHALPVVSVVGTRTARLFVAGRVLDALTPEEMAAAVAHENAHLAAHDNLKRWALRLTPDLLAFLPIGGDLERAWVRASESAADARAVGADRKRALDLGAALLKVAALAAGRRVDVFASALDDGGEIASRVRRLAEGSTIVVLESGVSRRHAALVATAALVVVPLLWAPVHGLLEAVVALLR